MNEQVREWLRHKAIEAHPYEACGFILKDGSVIQIPNVASDPRRSFLMSRDDLIEMVPNPDVIEGIWHTHPRGTTTPSAGDMEMLRICQWRYFIVTTTQVVEYDPKVFAPQDNSFWNAFSA